MQRTIEGLYAEAERAVEEENYNDASLLQGRADLLFEAAENLATVIEEIEDNSRE